MKNPDLGNICASHINHSNEWLRRPENLREYESEMLKRESQGGTDDKITDTRPATLI